MGTHRRRTVPGRPALQVTTDGKGSMAEQRKGDLLWPAALIAAVMAIGALISGGDDGTGVELRPDGGPALYAVQASATGATPDPSGGTFRDAWHLYTTLRERGAGCERPERYTFPRIPATIPDREVIRCWTGVGHVIIYVSQNRHYDPRNASWAYLDDSAVFGENWVIMTGEDPRFSAVAQSLVGGYVYLR